MLYEVATTADIPEGEARRFVVDRVEIAVVNLGNGQFLAVDDICSHAEASLSEGEVDIDLESIECPRHGSTFDLRTGKPLNLPAYVPIDTYAVEVEDGVIKVEVD